MPAACAGRAWAFPSRSGQIGTSGSRTGLQGAAAALSDEGGRLTAKYRPDDTHSIFLR